MNATPEKPEKPERPKRPKLERAARPIESFGPELMAALLKAATEPLELEMPFKLAIRFRLRIHQLREAMRRHAHSEYALVSKVRVTITWPEGTELEHSGRYVVPKDRQTRCLVRLQPNDAEFGDILTTAGVSVQLRPDKSDGNPKEVARSLPVETLSDLLDGL